MQCSLGVPRDVAESSLVQSVKRAGEGDKCWEEGHPGQRREGKNSSTERCQDLREGQREPCDMVAWVSQEE